MTTSSLRPRARPTREPLLPPLLITALHPLIALQPLTVPRTPLLRLARDRATPLARWAALYHRYDHYTAALDELGIPLRWQHFMWAAHVHHALRVSAGVHAVLDVGVSVNLVRNVANANGRSCVPGVSTEQHIPALAEPVKPGMARLCPRRGEVRCLIGSKRCLLDGEFPQSMQDSNRTSAPTPELRRPTRLATHARKPRSLRSPRKAKGRERLAKRVGWNPVLG